MVINRIYNQDCLKTMAKMPDNFIDLVVTSPPYNVGKEYDSSSDSLDYDNYIEWCKLWLAELARTLKPSGRLCLNIPFDIKVGKRHHPLLTDLVLLAQFVNLDYKLTITWDKSTTHGRMAWGSWKSASAPHLINPQELIVVLYKDQWAKLAKGESDISAKEFTAWTFAVWKLGKAYSKTTKHPAPFPEALPMRCIKMFSYVGDLVYDPFMGSGTTAKVARLLDRRYLGSEISREYCRVAKQRLSQQSLNLNKGHGK